MCVLGGAPPVAATKAACPLAGAGPKNSPSGFRFRPPHPTGFPLRDCSLFVQPLGRGFDLLAFRARRKEETTRTRSADQGLSEIFLSQFAPGSFSASDPDAVLAAGEGTPVEPAIAGQHLEACLAEERWP